MKPCLAFIGGVLCACAGQAGSQPTPVVEGRQPGSEVRKPATTHKASERQGDKTAEDPRRERSLDEIRLCPDPYGNERTGWVPKAWPSEEATRAMNERHGLQCTERPAEAPEAADGIRQVWGCVDTKGRVVVPFVYERISDEAFYFAESGLALVFKPREGWLYIDVADRKFGQAETIDNRPDETFGGYARFRARNGKVGYLDRDRRIAIPARYGAAFPFAKCTAQVCVGCRPDRWMKDAPGETDCTGEAFIIDESGKRLTGRLPEDAAYCATKPAPAMHK
jgi:hypothetical protein